ncbi:TonB-dependent receptor [Parasphingorhabdus sp.]|uniref:TonB-dependent receptor n=1 Tax=Parasphingorhabdus sp. TaxID=2709688 RepID=UPI003A940979
MNAPALRRALIATLVCTTSLQPARAQGMSGAAESDNSGIIIVTAQRREEASVDVPISITAIDNARLEAAGVQELSDIAKLTPSLRFDSQGPAVQPTIRGVGTAITTSGGGPNVGIYVDGFFQSNTYVSDFDLLKVDSIQVLKGPQGTLFGRNTTGGAILVTTAEPSFEPAAEFKAAYGRFNAVTLQAYGTTGLSDTVAMDVEGQFRRGDGYFTDLTNGDDEIGDFQNWSLRAGLKAELSDTVSILLRYTHTESRDPTTQLVNAFVDQTGEAGFLSQVSAAGQAIYGANSSQGLPLVYFFAPPGTYATNPGEILLNPPVSFKTNSDNAQISLTADLGFAELISYSQYRNDQSPYFGDLDATALPFFNIYVGVDDETWSQEFLLNSKPGGPLQWTAGLNYFRVRDTWDVDASFGLAPFFDFGGSSTTTTSYAAFLDVTYELTDRLFLTAGGRYSHDIVDDAYFTANPFTTSYIGPNDETVPFNGAPGTRIAVDKLKNDSFTPRAAIRFKPDERSSLYASYTRGYKAGILNVGGLSQQPVEPEEIDAFELGYKYAGSRLSLDLAGFYYDYKNLQVSSFQNGAAQIRNAASSEIYGLEGQVQFRATDAFNIFAGASWTHARYKSFPNAPFYSFCDPAAAALTPLWCVPQALGGFGPGALVQTSTDASGFKMQRAPEFTGNLGASYELDLGNSGGLTLSGNLYYTSSFFFDPEQQFRQKGYELLSLRAEWKDAADRFSIAVFGDNLTNRSYRSQVLFNTLGIGSVWASPATWGISAGFKY